MIRTTPELEEVLRIARRAADRVLEVYGTAFTVDLKGPSDPVTRADREANDIICQALEASFPGDAILAEESVPAALDQIRERTAQPRVWFVDPLDGTREFIDRNGEFAVMIGLAVGGRASLGVVVLPATGEALLGCADEGQGAIAVDRDGHRRAVQVSKTTNPAEATMVVSRSHRPAVVGPVVEALSIRSIVPCGSVGVKIARIALQHADLYVHGGRGAKRWDTAAPEAILKAAGGRFTDLDGAEIDYRDPNLELGRGIVASNGALHEAVLGVTRGM